LARLEILENSSILKLYLSLFTDVDTTSVKLEIKNHLKKAYDLNTLGARLVNTLIHQYFIKGGLTEPEVEEISFQNKLTFNKKTLIFFFNLE
jgi:hypothetical protein